MCNDDSHLPPAKKGWGTIDWVYKYVAARRDTEKVDETLALALAFKL